MRKRVLYFLILAIALLLVTSPVFAQDYYFSLDQENVHVYWEEDGTLTIFYELLITNLSFSPPVEYVDIGLPNNNYHISNITAEIDGKNINHIQNSSFVDIGIELGLEENSIFAGNSGRITAWIQGIEGVLYPDSSDESYASAVFIPNWFGSQYIDGTTDVSVTFHLPPGVQVDEPRYHDYSPSGFPSVPIFDFDNEGRITYGWRNLDGDASTEYKFGASFPKTYVPESAIARPSFWQTLGIDLEVLIPILVTCGFFLVFFSIPALVVYGGRRRKLKYLPPKIAIEGHGIKRGLTAIEAAILLEHPMDKILTMMLFAVIKKNAAKVVKKKPLKINIIAEPPPKNLRKYELEFLEALQKGGKAKRRRGLQKMMVTLVKSVTRKMKGFSNKETVAYYKDIVRRAWGQVEAADTPEVRSEKYDEVMEWTMLDGEYEDRTRDVFQHHPVFIPMWWGRYDPGYRGTSARRTTSTPSSRGAPALPHLPGSDFAASIVSGVQDFSAGVVGSLTDFTGGVTKVTNPPPVSTSSGRSGGGGGSCACACACAGCACACAGGGR